jgi:NAD(P)-dependent dehydrogenase (short-subunit alcohol dehydrogenase family)
MTWRQWQEFLATRTHPRRLVTLAEMAEMAAFLASDKASGMTGTTVNLTMGSLDDQRPARGPGRRSRDESR